MNFYLELFLKYSNTEEIYCGFLATLPSRKIPLSPVIFSTQKQESILPATAEAWEFKVQQIETPVCYCCNPTFTFQLDHMMVFALKMKSCNVKMRDLKQTLTRTKKKKLTVSEIHLDFTHNPVSSASSQCSRFQTILSGHPRVKSCLCWWHSLCCCLYPFP